MKEPIKRDTERIQELNALLQDPHTVSQMDEETACNTVRDCVAHLRHLRMGGRSSSLIGLCVVLWNRPPHELLLDVEELLALAFHIAGDGSYVQPEWAVVMAGVLIAKYSDRIPDEARNEVHGQCRLLLEHLKQAVGVSPAVRASAAALLGSWDEGFSRGVDDVVRSGLGAWPDTTDVSAVNDREFEEVIAGINKTLPISMSEKQRKFYRLFLDRRGLWQQFQTILLK